MGFAVAVQSGAGTLAGFSDAVYVASGATIVSEAEAWNQVWINISMLTLMLWLILQFLHTAILQRIVLKCRPPSVEAVSRMNPEQLVISFIYPASEEGKVCTEPSAVWLDDSFRW